MKRDGNKVAHRLVREALKISSPLLCLESVSSYIICEDIDKINVEKKSRKSIFSTSLILVH